MKRFIYLASALALLASMVFVGNAFAAHPQKFAKVKLSFCSSGPLAYPGYVVLWQGVQNAVQIAIHQNKTKLAKVGVHISYPSSLRLDDGDPSAASGGYSTTKEITNAHTCLGVTNTIAYMGTLNSGATLESEPIINRAHMLMISPANTNPDLTSKKAVCSTSSGVKTCVGGRKTQEPLTYSHKLKHVTFYRTVTTDKLQGPAGAVFAHNTLHEKSYILIDDGTLYGEGLATFFDKTAHSLGMKKLGFQRFSGANAHAIAQYISGKNPSMLYCGCNPPVAPIIVDARTQFRYKGVWMGGDALENPAWLSNGEAGRRGGVNNDVTLTGPAVQRTAKFFITLQQKEFHSFYVKHGTQPYDASAYDAATAALISIYRAAKHHKLVPAKNQKSIIKDRNSVLSYMPGVKFTGATGKNGFDANGDTTNKVISIYSSVKINGHLTWKFLTQVIPTGSPT